MIPQCPDFNNEKRQFDKKAIYLSQRHRERREQKDSYGLRYQMHAQNLYLAGILRGSS
jgi:hypothetical protein